MDEVADIAYGNPSSMHMAGIRAEDHVKRAGRTIAGTLKAKEKEILFTSGGTESDNMALIGCAMANKRSGKHLITTKIEHPAVLETMKFLGTQGFEVTYLDVDKSGRVRNEDLESALCKDTILVSIMYVNNEIGARQRISELSRLVKSYDEKIIFHSDAVQGYGKYRIIPRKEGIDLLSVSGHKIHGPKGVGFLYIRDGVKINPIIFGGGQQRGLRSGTENVPGISGIGRAAELIYEDLEARAGYLYELKEFFIKELSGIEGISINGIPDLRDLSEAIRETAPHIVSASVEGVRAEVLLHALEEREIYVSSGSACSSNKPAVSETLKAIGLPGGLLDSTIRFSFSFDTTREQLEYTIKALNELIPKLRLYQRG